MPQLSTVDVHIWYQDTASLDDESIGRTNQLLCEEERERRDRFHFHKDRRDFAAAHGLLREALSKYSADRHPADWRFRKDAFGKPHLAGDNLPAPLEFNLSHTTGFVACAISSKRVGIDVERVRQNMDYEALVQSQFSREEFKMVNELSMDARVDRVIELWTLKEAFLKAVGQGLSGALDSIWFELDSNSIRFHAPEDFDVGKWKFALFSPQPRLRMAVVVESTESPRIFMQGMELSLIQERANWL